ncbi:hypothetical protein ACZ90_22440 [Streptomyces albus subsp. albus]|nr:hypothetical protein ACZ90_22440 [Streptomyces albus subsp. albus]
MTTLLGAAPRWQRPPEDTVLGFARWGEELPPLHRAERQLAAELPAARGDDFRLGRAAAARSLRGLGRRGPVLADGRMPRFPGGTVGSISHRNGAAVCLAAWSTGYRAVGVDIETAGFLPLSAARILCTSRERAWLAGQPDTEEQLTELTALFSVKEAAYKALCGLDIRIDSFKEIDLPVDSQAGALRSHTAEIHGVRLETGGVLLGWTVLTWAVARL